MEMDLAERFFIGLAFVGASCLGAVFTLWLLSWKVWPGSVNRRAVSQGCGIKIANSNPTGISALSLRMKRCRDMNFEPGSVLFRD